MAVILQVMVVFVLIGVGYVCARFKWIQREGFRGLNNFILYLSMPALALMKMQITADGQLLLQLLIAFACATIAMLISCGVALILFKNKEQDHKAVYTNMVTFANSGFMGFPVVEACLGEEALIYAVMFVASFNLLSFSLGAILYSGEKTIQWKKIITTPSIIAVLLGFVCLLTPFKIPMPFSGAFDMLASTTTPLAMVVIGAQLVGLPLKTLKNKDLMLSCFLRLVACPVVLLLFLRLTGLPTLMTSTLFVCYAMPSAALVAIQADQYHCEPQLASTGVALSSALSMLTIPLMLLFIL